MRPRAIVLWVILLLGLSVALQTGLELGASAGSGEVTYLPVLQRAPQSTATRTPTPTRTRTPTPTATPGSSWAEQVVSLVNAERTSQGLAPLSQVSELMQSAALHSQDMATHDFMSHTGSDGSDPGDRMRRAGYDWYTYGENVAAGYGSPASVVAGWMGSSGHRANILDSDFRDVGAGYAYSSTSTYGHYWTLNLGAR